MEDLIYKKSVEYLETDLFKHIATLKYLSLYHDRATVSFVEEAPQWAVSVMIPTDILAYDLVTYPEAKKAVFINGTSDKLKYNLLDSLPSDDYILRLNEALDLATLGNRFNISKGNSFISFFCSSPNDISTDSIVSANNTITDEAINLFVGNEYTEAEIRKYFGGGALWFGLIKDDEIKSICFIYYNYGDIWEIAGVHTLITERNKGYARIVINSALKYIFDRNCVPRYVTEYRNVNSVKLALGLGLKEFLRVNHFLLNPR